MNTVVSLTWILNHVNMVIGGVGVISVGHILGLSCLALLQRSYQIIIYKVRLNDSDI